MAVEETRELERLRQREHRRQERVVAGTNPALSRAGLCVQVREAVEEIMAKLGQAQRLSRAGLRRHLFRFARFSQGEVDHAEAKCGT